MIYPGDQLENPVKLGLDSSVYVLCRQPDRRRLKGYVNLEKVHTVLRY
jgi:hypothetical protein